MTRPVQHKKERLICPACGTGKTVDTAIWKRQGKTQCGGCGRWIAYQDINAPEGDRSGRP